VQERERKLQTNLIAKIDRFMRGDTDGFAFALMNEAQRLSEAAYGSAFLHHWVSSRHITAQMATL